MEVRPVHTVDLFLYSRNAAEVIETADISVEHGISKSEVILVSFAAKTVGRRFVDELLRKSEEVADLEHFGNGEVRERGEVTGSIAVLC